MHAIDVDERIAPSKRKQVAVAMAHMRGALHSHIAARPENLATFRRQEPADHVFRPTGVPHQPCP